MGSSIENSSFVIIAHRVFPSIVDDLKKYLLDRRCGELWYIIHEFNVLETRRSFIEHYKDGRLVDTHCSIDYSYIPDPYVNLKDFLYTIFWMLFRVRSGIDVFIGLGGFNAACGTLLRRIKRMKKVIFYTVDYVPSRFDNRMLNDFYHFIDKHEVSHASETWNVSPRMAEGREHLRGLRREDYPNQKVVPIGLWSDEIRKYGFDDINSKELIFIGNLVEKQGVQLVLEAVPQIVKEVEGFQFRIIGTGAFEGKLKELARELDIEPYVIFEGPIPDQDVANDKLAHAALAVAMYDKRFDDFSYYADPGKIKTYLSTGLPVLLTDLPYNAQTIEDRRCGMVLPYDREAVARAVIELLNDEEKLREYRKNAVEYARRFDWNYILDTNLARTTMGDLREYDQYKDDLFRKLGFNFEAGRTLLDIGCGDATDLRIFAREYGLDVCGIDVYRHENVNGFDVMFKQASILAIPFTDDRFDYVFAHDVLHHIDEAHQDRDKHIKGLKEMSRVTRKGGYTVIVEGNRYNPLFYPHVVKMMGHNHFKQSYFKEIVSEVFDSVEFKFFEAHLYPKWGFRFWKLYERIMEGYMPTRILAYNVAIARK